MPESKPSSSESPDAGASRFKYFAFISYSRADDRAAKWLQKRLEWFRLPVKLVAHEHLPPHPKYVRPIYRDKTNLEVDHAHYWQNIKQAIEQSRFLIVLCSPHSAKSGPVDLEVSHFLETRGSVEAIPSVVPVILSGRVTAQGDDACLCPALGQLGEQLTTRNLPTMVPDAGDPEQEGWENGFLGLIAYLLSLKRESLTDHVRREERKLAARSRLLAAVFAVLALAAGGLGWMAKLKSEQVSAAALQAKQALAEAWTDKAVDFIDSGDHLRGMSALSAALRCAPAHDASRMLSRLLATDAFLIPRRAADIPRSTHLIRQGDSLMRIASQYGIEPDHLLKSNPDISPSSLRVGLELDLPRTALKDLLQSSKQQTFLSATSRWQCDTSFSANAITATPLKYEQGLTFSPRATTPRKETNPSLEEIHKIGIFAFHPTVDLAAIVDETDVNERDLTILDLKHGKEHSLRNPFLSKHVIPVHVEWISDFKLAIYASINGTICDRWEVVVASIYSNGVDDLEIRINTRFQVKAEDIAYDMGALDNPWRILRDGHWTACEAHIPGTYQWSRVTMLNNPQDFTSKITPLNSHPARSLTEADVSQLENDEPVPQPPIIMDGSNLRATVIEGGVRIHEHVGNVSREIIHFMLPGYSNLDHYDYGLGFVADDEVFTFGASGPLRQNMVWIQSSRSGRSLIPPTTESAYFVAGDGSFLVSIPELLQPGFLEISTDDFLNPAASHGHDSETGVDFNDFDIWITPVGLPPADFLKENPSEFLDSVDTMLGLQTEPLNLRNADQPASRASNFTSPFDADINPSFQRWIKWMKRMDQSKN